MEEKLAGNIVKLGRLGLVGVMIGLIVLTGFSVYALWNLVGNHLDHSTQATIHNTDAWNKNTEVLGELKGSVNLLSEVIRQKIR